MSEGLPKGERTTRRHRKNHRGVSAAFVVALLIAFALGGLAATALAKATWAAPGPAPPTPTPHSAPPTTSPTRAPGPPAPGPPQSVGFAQPAVTATGLEVVSVLTKVHGGVDVTIVASNRSDQPITVDATNLGPHDVTFRGAPVPTQMTGQSKKLVPGEALVYPCRVSLPDMNSGQLSLTVAGIPVSGPAAGD
jgi:hypothetical protein